MQFRALLLGTAALAVAVPSVAHAQDSQYDDTAAASDESEAQDTGDIIVTANRTASLLSKTPIALTAVSGENLIQAGITNPTQLEETVPNLSIVRANGLQITIRGVTSTDNTEKGDPSAAFMVNGIYIARAQSQEVSFYDIERVEVLRGPQGTLYGRNSTAGVVNILTAKPKFDFGARGDIVYGNFDALNLTAMVNLPVSDKIALRIAGNIDQRDSYLIDGRPNDGISFDRFKENKSIRVSALFEPTEDLSLLLVGDYSTIKGKTANTVPPGQFFANIVSGPRPTFERPRYVGGSSEALRTNAVPQAQETPRDNSDFGIMGELNYSFGDVTFTYLGSYREFQRREFQTAINGLVGADFRGDYWQTSHEARLAYGNGGPLQVQVGAFYFKEESGIAFFLNNLVGANTRFGFPQDPTISENKSVFGQATYEITEGLRLTGGIRYSVDDKSRVGQTVIDRFTSVVNSGNIGDFISRTVTANNNAARTFKEVTWRAGVDYDTALGLVFASVSTGYKAGGFNDGCELGTATGCTLPAGALYYDPETLTAYEAGFKFRIGPALRLNGTIFHYDYQDLQLSQVSDICGGPCQVTTNAAAAKVDGVELDAVVQPSDRLAVRLQLNWLDARYDSFIPRPGIDFAGRPLARSPRWSWIAGVNYTIPVGEGRIVADGQISSRSEADLTDLASFAYFYQPAFTKSDVSLTYNAPNDRFYVAAFVENIEDNVNLTSVITGTFANAIFSDPRTYGVRAGFQF